MGPDARRLDEVAGAATAATEEAHRHGWWAKASPDLPFRRASAVLPPCPWGTATTLDAALADLRPWYHRRGLRLLVQVSDADPGHRALDEALAARGLQVEAPVRVLVLDPLGPLDPLAPRLAGLGRSGAIPDPVVGDVDDAWVAAHGLVVGAAETAHRRARGYSRMLARHRDAGAGRSALGASVAVDGAVAAIGFAVVDRPWVGVFGMATGEPHRRQGLATAVLGALLAAARHRGADRAYLQVEEGNEAALALYRRLGFAGHHRYHYRSEARPVPSGAP